MLENDWIQIGEEWAEDAYLQYQEGTPKAEAVRDGKAEMTLTVELEGSDRWSEEWEAAEDGFIMEWSRLEGQS
jgi:hypothetical protein